MMILRCKEIHWLYGKIDQCPVNFGTEYSIVLECLVVSRKIIFCQNHHEIVAGIFHTPGLLCIRGVGNLRFLSKHHIRVAIAVIPRISPDHSRRMLGKCNR
uniref:Uncharacterized protein n=1 Tax=Cacopsylla melanoneura TaxID=428564 RepID=A0A8D9APR6_9HEMI